MDPRTSTLFVVQSNPVPGGEDEYNRWYNDVHLPDILAIPGFVAAQRFRSGPVQRHQGQEHAYTYLALYEIAGDAQAAFDGIETAKKAGMSTSPMMHPDRATQVFEPFGARVQSPNFPEA